MQTIDDLVALLNARLAAEPPAARPQPPSTMLERRLTRAEDLLGIAAPAEFVRQAFRFVLKRDPEDEALRYYAGLAETGQRDRITILQDLLNSDEGKRHGCVIIGISPAETVLAGLVSEQVRQTAVLERIETELAAIAAQLHRIPRAQRALLEVIDEQLRARATGP